LAVGGDANNQSGDVDDAVVSVTTQASESSFKVVFKHGYLFCMIEG
jgi:hypothetical protein